MSEQQPESQHRPIPVEEAKRLAEKYYKTLMVIAGYDPTNHSITRTTYGVTAEDKVRARLMGDTMMINIGAAVESQVSHEDFRDEMNAARLREATELLSTILDWEPLTPDTEERVKAFLSNSSKPA